MPACESKDCGGRVDPRKRLSEVQAQLRTLLAEAPEICELLLEWFELRYQIGKEESPCQKQSMMP